MSVNFKDQLDQVITTSGILTQKDTGGLIVASGDNVANKPAASSLTNGLIRYNTFNNVLEAVINGVYFNLAIVPTGPVALVTGLLPLNGSLPMTGALGLISGTSSAPALYFAGNTSTGLYSPLPNTISIATNGTQALSIDASQNVTIPNLFSTTQSPGTNDATVATTAFVQLNLSSGTPIGSVLAFASTSLPVGYLSCGGQAVSRSTYAGLFSVIGTTYGSGDGSSTFNVPNLQGYFLRGFDNTGLVDPGRVFGSSQSDIFGTHSHAVNDPTHSHGIQHTNGSDTAGPNISGANPGDPQGGAAGPYYGLIYQAATGITINPTGGSETRPKNVAMTYCIKYKNVSSASTPTIVSASNTLLTGNWVSNTLAMWSAEQLILENSLGTPVLLDTYNQTINTSIVGVGGLDTGSLTASSWYYVWAIYNSTTTTLGIIMSLSSSSPTMPSGYDFSSRIGTIKLDGSSKIVGFKQVGGTFRYILGSNLALLYAMAAGSTGNVYIPVSVSSFVPPTAFKISLLLFAEGSNGTFVAASVAPNSNYQASLGENPTTIGLVPPMGISSSGGNTTTTLSMTYDMFLESNNVYFAAATTDGYLNCLGWEENF